MKSFSEVHARLLELHRDYEAALEARTFNTDMIEEREKRCANLRSQINDANELLKIVSKRPPEQSNPTK